MSALVINAPSNMLEKRLMTLDIGSNCSLILEIIHRSHSQIENSIPNVDQMSRS